MLREVTFVRQLTRMQTSLVVERVKKKLGLTIQIDAFVETFYANITFLMIFYEYN